MNTLVDDATKDVAVFINDFYPELPPALERLSKKLGRPLKGVMLVDKKAHLHGQYHPDKDHVFETVVCDFSNPADLRRTVKNLEDRMLLIDTTSERGQPYFKRVLPHVPYLPAPTETSLEWATHKGQMRAVVGAYNPNLVPHVQVVRDSSEDTVASVLKNLKLPYIVKPTGLAASILVNKVSTEEELRETLEHSFSAIDEAYDRYAGRWEPEMIVEEFMEGDMYSVDLYLNDQGRAWALPLIRAKTAHAMGLDGFYEYQLETDIVLDADTIREGQHTAIEAAHAIGLRSCTAHVELYLTPTGWKIIELGPRPGGWRQFLYQSAYGIDHAYNELLIKVGLEPEELNATPIAYSLIANTYADQEGVIESVNGIDETSHLASAVAVEVHCKPGDIALASGKGGKILVDISLSNKDKQQLVVDTGKARQLVTIHTKQPAESLV
ncbi:MAG TPA: ATP-grasp domain-containing protein [Candidatus Saccharimonadia bacterium]|nr:ATP-grasp domain-containing protein [Candidatus Saccharimonadia bacterium]